MFKVKIWGVLLFIISLSSSGTLLAASDYVLDSANSSLYFVSTKQTHVVENHHFTDLSGAISESGDASLSVRDLLFEVGLFSEARVTLPVNLERLAAQTVGSAQSQGITASLNLHGVIAAIDTEVIVTKLSDSKIMVQNASPILIDAGDFNLRGGIDALRNIANLDVISYAVPVNFTLLFSAR